MTIAHRVLLALVIATVATACGNGGPSDADTRCAKIVNRIVGDVIDPTKNTAAVMADDPLGRLKNAKNEEICRKARGEDVDTLFVAAEQLIIRFPDRANTSGTVDNSIYAPEYRLLLREWNKAADAFGFKHVKTR